MNQEAELYFARAPAALPIYRAVEDAVLSAAPGAVVCVQRTQITFRAPRVVACASLPYRRYKGLPEVCVILTFGLPRRENSPRIWQAAQINASRWTHHVVIADPADLDGEILSFLRESYALASR